MKHSSRVFAFLFLLILSLTLIFTACDIEDESETASTMPDTTVSEEQTTEPPVHTHIYGEWIDEVPATCLDSGIVGHYSTTNMTMAII